MAKKDGILVPSFFASNKVDTSGNRTYVSRSVQIGRVDTTAPVEYNFGSVSAGNYVVEMDNDTVGNPPITGIIRVYEEYY